MYMITIISVRMGKPRKTIKRNLRYRNLNNKERGRGHYNRWMGEMLQDLFEIGDKIPRS